MKYDEINSSLFIQNRKNFIQKLNKHSIAVFHSNDIMPTNADGSMKFKQNSNLFYLCGIDQEESVLVIYYNVGSDSFEEVMFVKETNSLIAIWEGEKLSKQKVEKLSGIKKVEWVQEFESFLKETVSKNKIDKIYINTNEHSRNSNKVETKNQRFIKRLNKNYSELSQFKSSEIIDELRTIKSETEIKLIKTACEITKKGFIKVLKSIKPGTKEYEIEAEFISCFLKNKATGFAYEPIIASGKNSCVLHYVANNKECFKDDIILMDVGAEYANYCADMTRCVPVNGFFSERQKQVYNAVLSVMKKSIKILQPNLNLSVYREEVNKIMEEELINIGLISMNDVKKQNPKNPAYRKYFMHGVSHYLGLDVHDVGDMNQTIKPGMIFTCEPGIYIPEENLGIRLENDILITESGNIDLMSEIPIEISEIESYMNKT